MRLITFLMLLFSTISNAQYFKVTERKKDTVSAIILVSDTATKSEKTILIYGYAVMEQYNTCEGIIDPYFTVGAKCEDYWRSVSFLDKNKLPLKKNLYVWNSLTENKQQ